MSIPKKDVARELRIIRNDYQAHVCEIDVRLCVRDDGSWWVAFGDVSYDTEHAPYCAATILSTYEDDAMLADTAKELIADIEDQIAMGDS